MAFVIDENRKVVIVWITTITTIFITSLSVRFEIFVDSRNPYFKDFRIASNGFIHKQQS